MAVPVEQRADAEEETEQLESVAAEEVADVGRLELEQLNLERQRRVRRDRRRGAALACRETQAVAWRRVRAVAAAACPSYLVGGGAP